MHVLMIKNIIIKLILLVCLICEFVVCHHDIRKNTNGFNHATVTNDNQQLLHRSKRLASIVSANENALPLHGRNPLYWKNEAQLFLKEQLHTKLNKNKAKNIIFFMGDGMSLTTVTAARIHLGQRNGLNGEDGQLSFEKFPHIGLSKTYCLNKQVADSACSSTAYLCGVKANYETIGVSGNVDWNDCNASNDPLNHVTSILQWAQEAGKSTGIVTNTHITDASPAGTYAHVGHREWESDFDVLRFNQTPSTCQDIARQLIENEPGKNFQVILGGGRKKFIPNTEKDESGELGQRLDKRNLINQWKSEKGNRGKYVYDRNGLLNLNLNETDYLFGLFHNSHLNYHLDANSQIEPTLSEMTEVAIKMLSKNNKNGFMLFVEGGQIDFAHHENRARKALDETIEFSNAIQTARELIDTDETLMVVTADHAHTMTISGYPERGNDILGLHRDGIASDKLPYTTLSYANGKGFQVDANGKRELIKENQIDDKDYQYPSLVPLTMESHGGEDVGVFALGPWAHLFTRILEQNVIPYIIGFAACIGNGLTSCDFTQS